MSMLRRVLNRPNHSIFVRTVGSLSCVVGLLCYPLGSSFKSLFGEWNPTNIILYIIFSSIITAVVFFAPKCPESVVSMLKPHVQFLVLMLSSLYSFFADRSKEGKPDTWSVVSSVAFALTFLCLSLQIKPEFDVGLCGFFLGHVTGQLMKIHLIFILVAASFCYPLVVLESYSESPSRNGDSSAQLDDIRIDSRDRESFGMGQHKAAQITHRRRVGIVSPSPSPRTIAILSTYGNSRVRSRFGKGGSSSSDPGNKSFEKLLGVADAEVFLSDIQEQGGQWLSRRLPSPLDQGERLPPQLSQWLRQQPLQLWLQQLRLPEWLQRRLQQWLPRQLPQGQLLLPPAYASEKND